MQPNAEDLRLGEFRRDLRDYSLKHRALDGKNAADRLYEQDLEEGTVLTALMVFDAVMSDEKEDEQDTEMLMLALVAMMQEHADLNVPYLSRVDPIAHHSVSLLSFSDEDLVRITGFTRPQIQELITAIKLPQSFLIGEGPKSFSVSGEHVFLWSLARFRSAYTPLWNHSAVWGYDYSTLSKMFSVFTEWMDAQHGHRLRGLSWSWSSGSHLASGPSTITCAPRWRSGTVIVRPKLTLCVDFLTQRAFLHVDLRAHICSKLFGTMLDMGTTSVAKPSKGWTA